MVIAGGLGNITPNNFSCSASGVCRSTNPAINALFIALQAELNRVRKIYGLPSDVTVDGKIGTGTLAKLIKTAQAIDKKLGERRDSALDDYVYTDIAMNVTPAMLAAEADVILASLRRNGVDPRYAAPVPIDPYADTRPPPIVRPMPLPPIVIPVGPTAPAPTAPPSPIATLPKPKGLVIGGIALGGLALAGLATAITLAIRNR